MGEDQVEAEERTDVDAGIPDAVTGRDLLKGVAIIWVAELVLGGMLAAACGGADSLDEHPVGLVIITLASGVIASLVAWHFLCRKYHKSFAEGFRTQRPTRKALLASILIALAMALVGAALSSAYSTGDHLFAKMMSTPEGMASLVVLSLLAPLYEELYYRGFIFTALEGRYGGTAAVLIVIPWFTAAHAAQAMDDWIAVPIVAVAGTVWTIQRRVTGSLTVSIVTHWTYNFALMVLSFLLS